MIILVIRPRRKLTLGLYGVQVSALETAVENWEVLESLWLGREEVQGGFVSHLCHQPMEQVTDTAQEPQSCCYDLNYLEIP